MATFIVKKSQIIFTLCRHKIMDLFRRMLEVPVFNGKVVRAKCFELSILKMIRRTVLFVVIL